MPDRSAPIGVFDSGLGGASVLREALRLLPTENYIYYGDNANAPYGDRPESEITDLTLACVHRLLDMGCKAILVACNTATANCIDIIRTELNVPVVSMEPAIRLACQQSGPGKVLMMATLATTRMERYLSLQQRMPDPARVINIPCPGIPERVEAGLLGDGDFDDLFDGYLAPYENLETDAIVLGCTHYVFLKRAIRRAMPAARLFDGNEGTARRLRDVLRSGGLENPDGPGGVEFVTSGDPDKYLPVFRMLFELPPDE